MKRLATTLVLLLGFLLTTGFTNDPGVSSITTDKDSTTVEVKFQNPRLIVSDERTSEVISEYLETRDSASMELFGALNRALDIVERDQERRYESAMDYLSRRTNIPPGELQTLIQTDISRQHTLFIIFALVYGVIIFVFVGRDTKRLKSWGDRFASMGYLLLYGVALYLLYCSVLRIIRSDEILFINDLIQLSG